VNGKVKKSALLDTLAFPKRRIQLLQTERSSEQDMEATLADKLTRPSNCEQLSFLARPNTHTHRRLFNQGKETESYE
jgi:hypothetical protein